MERIKQAMEQWDNFGTVQSVCVECGCDITAEPDAFTAYCYNCDKVVQLDNPLDGMI